MFQPNKGGNDRARAEESVKRMQTSMTRLTLGLDVTLTKHVSIVALQTSTRVGYRHTLVYRKTGLLIYTEPSKFRLY